MTVPVGFTAAGVASGIKDGGVLDVALIVAPPGSVGTGVFTRNKAAAAPVALSRSHVAAGPSFRAVVINSGCANAATGKEGVAAALAMAETVAMAIGCPPEEVFVGSTGAIGPRLPVIRVTAGIESAVKRLGSGAIADRTAAFAIMTTDTVPKQAKASVRGATVAGIAKGSGMVRPDLATMLVVLTTDAVVSPGTFHEALVASVDASFNSLNIDGCESTNDSVFFLASGSSGVELTAAELTALVTEVSKDLCFQLAADAEGTNRVITIEVTGASDDATARRAGLAVADSALVRSMFFSGDPNWGRIIGALGASGVDYEPDEVTVGIGGHTLAIGGEEANHGTPTPFDGNFTVTIGLGEGAGSAAIITTDLTPEYVIFNSEYS